MANRWFRVPAVDVIDEMSGKTIQLPKYRDEIDGWVGFFVGDSPRHVVRYYGTTVDLEAIATYDDVKDIDNSTAASLLDAQRGVNWTQSMVDESFNVGTI